jgi:hypothetical protein
MPIFIRYVAGVIKSEVSLFFADFVARMERGVYGFS